MIENLAVVARRDGGAVTVVAASRTGCARCDAGEGCGGGVLGRLIQRRLQGLRLSDPGLELGEGDRVVLGLPENVFLRATALTYLLPLLLLVLGAGLVLAAGGGDGPATLAGLAGLGGGMLAMPRLRHLYIDKWLTPTLLRRATATDLEGCGDV